MTTLTEEQRAVVEARRMVAVRAILVEYARDISRTEKYIRDVWKGHQIIPGIESIHAAREELANALAEVERMERGCGAEEGECTDPCHIGVR